MSEDNKIVKTELRRVVHLKGNWKRDDTLIKYIVDTLDNGEEVRRTEIVENEERPFYVTKKPYRKYKQKRCTEPEERVQRFTCTETDLPKVVPRMLPFPYRTMDYRRAKNCPWLYGVDQEIEYLAKLQYNKDTNPGRYRYAALDIETDVLNRFDVKVLLVSIAMGDKVITYVQDKFIKGINKPLEKLYAGLNTVLAEYVKNGLEVEYKILSGIEILIEPIRQLHKWEPDIVGVWNIDFDIPYLVKEMEEHNIKPEDVFSDPNIPKNLRSFYYKRGPSMVTTISGVDHRLGIHERWHTVYSVSRFEWLDAMCVFSEVRSQEAKRPSYSLGAILKEFLGIGKLSFPNIEEEISMEVKLSDKLHKDIDNLNSLLEGMRGEQYMPPKYAPINNLKHHQIMQEKYPIEYSIYSTFDPYSMILLDREIKDMELKVPVFMGASPMRYLPKRTKRLNGYLHEFARSNHHVPGTSYTTYPDEQIVPLSGWIITADAYLRKPTGIKCFANNASHTTNIYCNLLDVDLISSYPNLFDATRASRATRYTTISSIDGKVVTDDQKKTIVGWMHGPTNAADVSVNLLAKPSLQALLEKAETYL